MKRVIRIGLVGLASFVGTSAYSLWEADHRAPLISRVQFFSQVEAGKISDVGIDGRVAYFTDTAGVFSRVVMPDNTSAVINDLQRRGVKVGIHVSPNRNLC